MVISGIELMQIKDLVESLGHSEVTQSVSAVIVVNMKPKEQRQDQDQGSGIMSR